VLTKVRLALFPFAQPFRQGSRLVLPVVPGVTVPAKAPPCASLRSQPCRTYPG
jgi:hypothetical protein